MTLTERCRLCGLLETGLSIGDVAHRLGRHRKTTTFIAGLRTMGMVAPLVIDRPINGEWFEDYVAQVLVPTLKPGDVVILDTCPATNDPPLAR